MLNTATHSSVLAWRIPGTGKPGGLPSMGSHRVGHDWSDLAAAAAGLTLSQKWLMQLFSIWFEHFRKKSNNNSLFNGKIFRISVKYKTFLRENVACWRCLHSQYLPQYLTFKSHSTHICSMIENFYHEDTRKQLGGVRYKHTWEKRETRGEKKIML